MARQTIDSVDVNKKIDNLEKRIRGLSQTIQQVSKETSSNIISNTKNIENQITHSEQVLELYQNAKREALETGQSQTKIFKELEAGYDKELEKLKSLHEQKELSLALDVQQQKINERQRKELEDTIKELDERIDFADRQGNKKKVKELTKQRESAAKVYKEGLLEGKPNAFRDDTTLGRLLNKIDDRETLKEKESIDTKLFDSFDDLFDTMKDLFKDIKTSLNQSIEKAADVLAQNYGLIQYNLEGSSLTYKDIDSRMESFMTISGLVKQTDYLNNIAQLTSQGIVNNVEQVALLDTIKDKVFKNFDASNESLRRLIRIFGQDFTAESLGLEVAMRSALNATFGDSSYLNSLYTTITTAVTDSMALMGYGESTPFYATLQSWTSAMYEAGVSDSTVSKIASGINYLGSGNISALASDADLQRLILLSMDKAGMDYADVLQTGLNSSNTNALLSSMVDYLAEIAGKTSDNHVLESAYTNLFGISIADITSFQKLSSLSPTILASTNDELLAVVQNELDLLGTSQRTYLSEKLDNFMANLNYSYGKEIAGSNVQYSIYKVADTIMNLSNSILGENGTGGGRFAGVVNTINNVATAAYMINSGLAAIKMIPGIASAAVESLGGGNSILAMFNSINNTVGSGDASYLTNSASGSSKNSMLKTLLTTANADASSLTSAGDESYWSTAEESTTDKVLKELEQAIMKNEETGGYAIAVSLEGMSNEVLKSFASIFADEDAMAETFTGQNNVFEKALFEYASDTTSNATTV